MSRQVSLWSPSDSSITTAVFQIYCVSEECVSDAIFLQPVAENRRGLSDVAERNS
jgi:hypothetical protein